MIQKNVKNNKGYMLVEVVLASVIAFGIAYFLISLTINLKNKNDDIFVETQVATDKAILANALMESLFSGKLEYKCEVGDINISTQAGMEYIITLTNGTKVLFNKYENVIYDPSSDCIYSEYGGFSMRNIHLVIPQLKDKNFDVLTRYKINDGIPPLAINGLSVSNVGPTVTANISVDDTSKVASYGWKLSSSSICDSSVTDFITNNSSSYTFSDLGSFGKYYVCSKLVDKSGSTHYSSSGVDFSLKPADYILYTSATTRSTTVNQCTFNPAEMSVWRMLRKNSDGTIDIIGDESIGTCTFFLPYSDYDSYPNTLTNLAKKFENSTYTVGSRYPSRDENGTELIKNVLGTYGTAYFINERYISNGKRYFCTTWNDPNIYCWSDIKTYWNGMRPIVILKSGLKYKSGNGTKNNPYVLTN